MEAQNLDRKQVEDAAGKGIDCASNGAVFDPNYRAALLIISQWAVKKASNWSSIFATSATPFMLSQLLRLGPHFLYTEFMKVGWLIKNMSNIHGGVRTAHSHLWRPPG